MSIPVGRRVTRGRGIRVVRLNPPMTIVRAGTFARAIGVVAHTATDNVLFKNRCQGRSYSSGLTVAILAAYKTIFHLERIRIVKDSALDFSLLCTCVTHQVEGTAATTEACKKKEVQVPFVLHGFW